MVFWKDLPSCFCDFVVPVDLSESQVRSASQLFMETAHTCLLIKPYRYRGDSKVMTDGGIEWP